MTGRPVSPSDFLTGAEYASIDEKGRLVISPEKRLVLRDGFWMSYDSIGCILLLPSHIAVTLLEFVNGGSFNAPLLFDESVRHLLREFVGSLEKGSVDSAGRTVIPRVLRDDAGITKENKEVRVVGCGHFAEIWETNTYQAYRKKAVEEKGGSMSALLQDALTQKNRILEREVPLPKNYEDFDR